SEKHRRPGPPPRRTRPAVQKKRRGHSTPSEGNMASVFRQTYKRPVPEGAEIVTRKVKGKPQRFARWKDRRGRTKTAPLSEDGKSIVLFYNCWYYAYRGANGRRIVVQGYPDKEATAKLARDQEKLAARIKQGLVTVDMGKEGATFQEALDA